jgi:hypothetical protein
MTTTNPPARTLALEALRAARTEIYAAQLDLMDAQRKLYGARSARAGELVEKIAGGLAQVKRLIRLVERDADSLTGQGCLA